jgi:hypothetical protein
MQAVHETWNDERMDEFATRTEANFGEVRQDLRAVRVETREQGEALRDEILQQGKDLRGEIAAARDHTDRGLAGLRAEMNERFTSLDRRFDTQTGAMIAGFISLIVIHFVG